MSLWYINEINEGKRRRSTKSVADSGDTNRISFSIEPTKKPKQRTISNISLSDVGASTSTIKNSTTAFQYRQPTGQLVKETAIYNQNQPMQNLLPSISSSSTTTSSSLTSSMLGGRAIENKKTQSALYSPIVTEETTVEPICTHSYAFALPTTPPISSSALPLKKNKNTSEIRSKRIPPSPLNYRSRGSINRYHPLLSTDENEFDHISLRFLPSKHSPAINTNSKEKNEGLQVQEQQQQKRKDVLNRIKKAFSRSKEQTLSQQQWMPTNSPLADQFGLANDESSETQKLKFFDEKALNDSFGVTYRNRDSKKREEKSDSESTPSVHFEKRHLPSEGELISLTTSGDSAVEAYENYLSATYGIPLNYIKELLKPLRKRSPTLFTSSRKLNRSSRMTQGPQQYHSFTDILLDFCARTSSHGVPFIGTHSFFGRLIWSIITVLAFSAFCIQTYFTLHDYLQYRTIIEMQLKFEPAPFPAATLCNLNSFKFSELRKFEEIEQGFTLWERAISNLDRMKEKKNGRVKRHAIYEPIYVKCVCNDFDDQCVPQLNHLDLNTSTCLCFQDIKTGDIWPCYTQSAWTQKTCYHCSNSNTCDDPDRPPNITSLIMDYRETDCLCQSISHYCLGLTRNTEIPWWNPYNYSVYPATEPPTPSAEVKEAFGLDNLYDRGAITTRTKENLIFLVAAMPRETRKQLSYTLDEFVLRCSFNSKDCDLKRDFQIQIDPEYGNCYTFNFNDSVELKNSRAGPMYGLRLLLNVNQSDYMPTTEAAGVRLVVHEQDQEPFPDTFGYSAPTGFVSSFGLKTKVLNRLDAPYGKCSNTFRPENYIYTEHYSPEGCYRNCFQQIIVERCGCGDPRFPLPNENLKPCDARNAHQRACLANETSVLGGFHHLTHDCHCIQPCTENSFETAYSAAAWPALNFKFGDDDCAHVLEKENFTQEECTEYYRRNTAYIEIYYEQLNFESLRETAGYTIVNLFSDFGGNIGLWIGFSLITVLEFIEFFCECITFGCKNCVCRRFSRRGLCRKDHSVDGSLSCNSSVVVASSGNGINNEDQHSASTADDYLADLIEHDEKRQLLLQKLLSNDDTFMNLYFDPRRNSAINKQWRRRLWEQQAREVEAYRRQQAQEKRKGSTQSTKSENDGQTMKSLAAAFAAISGVTPGVTFVPPFPHKNTENGETALNRSSDTIITLPEASMDVLSTSSQIVVTSEQTTKTVPRVSATQKDAIVDSAQSEKPLATSTSINLMEFESGNTTVEPSEIPQRRALRISFKETSEKKD